MLIREELPMDAEDIRKVRRAMIPMFIFPVVVVLIFYFISRFIFNDMGDSIAETGFKWVFFGFGLIFMGVIAYMIWAQVIDIKRGIKHRIEGEVTDKRLDIQTSKSSSRNKTRTTRKYFVYIEGEEFKMDYKYYAQVKVGDRIQLEMTPKSGYIFFIETLTAGDSEIAKEEERIDTKFLNTQIEELPLTDADRDALKTVYGRDLKRKLTWMVPFILIIIYFIASDMWGLLVFLFPLVIIPFVQVIGLIKRAMRYKQNISLGLKEASTALIQDKLTITTNRNGNSNSIRTSWGSIAVTPQVYGKLDVGDKIVIYKAKSDKKPLSIMTLDQEEFYLM